MKTQNAKNRAIFIWGLLGGVIAAAASIITLYVAGAFDVSFVVPSPREESGTMEIETVPVLLSTIGPAIVAILLVMILNRFTKKPFTIYLVIAILVLLVSFYPLSMDMSNNTRIALGLMHVFTAVGISYGLYTAFQK
jgi:energy-converting hydrogenase Eha subunit B